MGRVINATFIRLPCVNICFCILWRCWRLFFQSIHIFHLVVDWFVWRFCFQIQSRTSISLIFFTQFSSLVLCIYVGGKWKKRPFSMFWICKVFLPFPIFLFLFLFLFSEFFFQNEKVIAFLPFWKIEDRKRPESSKENGT